MKLDSSLPRYLVSIEVESCRYPIFSIDNNSFEGSSCIPGDSDYVLWYKIIKEVSERLQLINEPKTPPSGV